MPLCGRSSPLSRIALAHWGQADTVETSDRLADFASISQCHGPASTAHHPRADTLDTAHEGGTNAP